MKSYSDFVRMLNKQKATLFFWRSWLLFFLYKNFVFLFNVIEGDPTSLKCLVLVKISNPYRCTCQSFCAFGPVMRLNGLARPSYLEEGPLVAMASSLRHPCGLGNVGGLDRYLSFRISLAISSPGIMLPLFLLGLETSATSIFRHEPSQVN